MDIYEELRNRINEATKKNKADAILLSGGVDTSILAFVARPKIAFTVGLKDSQASDLVYAEKVANLLGIEHRKLEFSVEEALNTLPHVIRILRTFDLALPNDLSIYFGLQLARKNNAFSITTGDGSDELFAGYSYMAGLSPRDLGRYIREISKSWHFSAGELSRALGIEVKQPFMDKDFVSFALDVSPELKIKEGIGKYILRKSFEDLIPSEMVWRKKEPIEYGSGSTRLHNIIRDMVSDEEFQSATKETGIKFINKEHLFYYRIYKRVVGKIPEAKRGENACPCCGASIGRMHCQVCGFSRPLASFQRK
ncbi:MAG: asparagine synthase C-terminal domain-containing protein [Dehalococcoidia bacterium]|nr:asparagine synthase C-terminal domain-containing protein [Dehalococcoidia bacterium]